MNRKLIVRLIGQVLCLEAVCMLPSLFISLWHKEAAVTAFILSVAACLVVGIPLSLVRVRSPRFKMRDGYASTAFCWIFLAVFGALPYRFSGVTPNYFDGLFETVSGLTTTGATVLSELEQLPSGILFWRALTQWMGGMGILVLVLALVPQIGQGSMNLMRAESPGPISSKLLPKTTATAKVLYIIYIALTAMETVSLRIAGMPWFDSITTAFTTISTGGFSVRSASIAAYGSDTINWIIVFFMFVAAINFSLLYALVRRKWKEAFGSEELRTYTLIVLGAIALITVNRLVQTSCGFYTAFSEASFQVVSLISTTGYGTANYVLWPAFAQAVLLLVMFSGGCAGSTAGGMKVSRIVILCRTLKRDIMRLLHPREVRTIRFEGQSVDEATVSSVSIFAFSYFAILMLCTLIVSLDNVSFGTAFSSALTMISNVGPGIEAVGPVENFAMLSDVSKVTLSLTMLLGRLEIMPLVLLFAPQLWQKPLSMK